MREPVEASSTFVSAEVAEVDLTGVGDDDVRRLDVAVDEPTLVRGVQRVRHVGDDLDRALDGERAQIAEELVEVAPSTHSIAR